MAWTDPVSGETISGFREKGFLSEAFVNMLAVLGWNDGTEQEIYSLEELKEKFSIERVHKAGAKFNYEKAKWFNQEWIRKVPIDELSDLVRKIYNDQQLRIPDELYLRSVIMLIRDRCHLLPEFYTQGWFFFTAPEQWDLAALKPKWNAAKTAFFKSYSNTVGNVNDWNTADLEVVFKDLANAQGIKPGELQLPLRIMLVGEKMGPPVFEIVSVLGKEETKNRINKLLDQIADW
jgi:glutamyl-tRNA synthetase